MTISEERIQEIRAGLRGDVDDILWDEVAEDLVDEVDALREAAARYLAAVEALHTTHPTTAVHTHPDDPPMFAGAAITQHCAWECSAAGGRTYLNGEGDIVLIPGPKPHVAERQEWLDAKKALVEALGEQETKA